MSLSLTCRPVSELINSCMWMTPSTCRLWAVIGYMGSSPPRVVSQKSRHPFAHHNTLLDFFASDARITKCEYASLKSDRKRVFSVESAVSVSRVGVERRGFEKKRREGWYQRGYFWSLVAVIWLDSFASFVKRFPQRRTCRQTPVINKLCHIYPSRLPTSPLTFHPSKAVRMNWSEAHLITHQGVSSSLPCSSSCHLPVSHEVLMHLWLCFSSLDLVALLCKPVLHILELSVSCPPLQRPRVISSKPFHQSGI